MRAPTTPDVRVEAVTGLDDAAWDAALSSSQARFRFSHRSAAGRAFDAAFASHTYEPAEVTYTDGVRALFALVRVGRRVSRLSMLLGMPLGLEGTPIVVDGGLTFAHIRELFRSLDSTGTLVVSGGAGGSPPGATEMSSTSVLDLRPGFEAVWTGSFSVKNRNSCRKAERSGVTVEQGEGDAAVGEYYRLYSEAARSWGYSVPPYPRQLFSGFLGSGFGELWLARLDGNTVAGAVVLRGSHDLLYWSGAMDRRFQGVAPSNAVLRAVIESACTRGIEYFDFGASSSLTGVEHFKKSFGGQEIPYSTVELCSPGYRQLDRYARFLGRIRPPR